MALSGIRRRDTIIIKLTTFVPSEFTKIKLHLCMSFYYVQTAYNTCIFEALLCALRVHEQSWYGYDISFAFHGRTVSSARTWKGIRLVVLKGMKMRSRRKRGTVNASGSMSSRS